MSLIARILRALSPREAIERRNIAALARRLGLSREDAAWIVRRSRDVGYPKARAEFDAYTSNLSVSLERREGSRPPGGASRPAPDERAS